MDFPCFLKTQIVPLGKQLNSLMLCCQNLQKHTGAGIAAVAVAGDNAMGKRRMEAVFTRKVK